MNKQEIETMLNRIVELRDASPEATEAVDLMATLSCAAADLEDLRLAVALKVLADYAQTDVETASGVIDEMISASRMWRQLPA